MNPEDWQAKWIKPGVDAKQMVGLNGCSWIWSSHDGGFRQTPQGSVCFRTQLNLPSDAKIQRASVEMSADNSFVLSVNGKEALKGTELTRVEKATITDLVKPGENILAVLATNTGDAPSPAGVIGRVTVELTDGRQITLETGPLCLNP